MPSPSSAFSPTTISTRSDECAMDDGYRRCVTRCSGTPRLRLPQACVVGLEKRGVSAERAVAEEQSGDEACVIRTIERLVFPPAELAPALHERYPHLEGMEVNIDIKAMIRRAFTPSRLRPSPRADGEIYGSDGYGSAYAGGYGYFDAGNAFASASNEVYYATGSGAQDVVPEREWETEDDVDMEVDVVGDGDADRSATKDRVREPQRRRERHKTKTETVCPPKMRKRWKDAGGAAISRSLAPPRVDKGKGRVHAPDAAMEVDVDAGRGGLAMSSGKPFLRLIYSLADALASCPDTRQRSPSMHAPPPPPLFHPPFPLSVLASGAAAGPSPSTSFARLSLMSTCRRIPMRDHDPLGSPWLRARMWRC
ncbi:hypothetical protein K438DRAFT_1867829 [Mycena galopus ATCC 62051]|nr:hypothetical protein K438DRAFT_1867829 [Mycena galopus ATCC 62051]